MKNIVIFSDGTCSESDSGYPTNVRKMYNAVERRSKRQVAFYDPGVGTNLYKVTGAAFGVGISTNIKQCYEFIMDVYQPGDKIYLFGFSRGAYTVRSLAGMIHKASILKREHRSKIDQAFKLYKKKNNADDVTRFIGDYCFDSALVSVHCIGVWDTVSALGFPLSAVQSLNPFSSRWHGFHDARLHKEVKYGYQALCIDDQRKVFAPELWDESDIPDSQTLEQVWFVGMHSNVGGGYRRTGLSDITLQWMIEKTQAAGLHLWEDYQNKVLMLPAADGKIYDSRSGIAKVYIKAERAIPDNAKIHKSVFQRIENKENIYTPNNIPARYIVYS